MDQLEALHVVSDLHLGGVPGHQVFNQGASLGALIEHLAVHEPQDRVGLVLNGDIVDFLAAEHAAYFNEPNAAVEKLEAILEEEAFAPVWQALQRFVAVPGRALVLVLGNHDVELALPAVRARLLAHLSGGDAAAAARVRFAMDGDGYRCSVGDRRVRCIHGNDLDPWNKVDHDALRRIIEAQRRGGGARAGLLSPNAGTRFVVDVMNAVKAKYPFVDLLKPEDKAVLVVLASLHPPLKASVEDLGKLSLSFVEGLLKPAPTYLGGASLPAEPSLDDPRTAHHVLDRMRDHQEMTSVETWLDQAVKDHRRGLRPVDLGRSEAMLGPVGYAVDLIAGRDPRDDLRETLKKYLAEDRTFQIDDERDATFRAADKAVDPSYHFIVCGHTHLERALRRKRGAYFNSGTWIRLLKIPEEALASRAAFLPVHEALRSTSLEAVDAAKDLIQQPRTVVSIWAEGGRVKGELRHARGVDDPPGPPWQSVPGTCFSAED